MPAKCTAKDEVKVTQGIRPNGYQDASGCREKNCNNDTLSEMFVYFRYVKKLRVKGQLQPYLR